MTRLRLLCLLGVVDMCCSISQSAPFSYDALHCCHLVLLGGLCRTGRLLL